MTIPPSPSNGYRPWWPWIVLALGLAWTAIIRIPLVLNAEDHLDSDLAVDGLTLRDAVDGRWRWHYPGTPYIGILPVFASYPQAMVWGANPIALVSGGTVLWALVVASTFGLAWRAYGPSVASWAIVPLVFSSLGTIWLSGRITGGHLLALAWHAMAFAGLHACLTRGGWLPALLLGVWCGLGLYIDAMFLVTIGALAVAASVAWLSAARSRRGIVLAGVFLVGMAAGLLPREIGRRVDPFDAYPAQFAATFDPATIAGHAGLLFRECLPRLIAGIRLPSLAGAGPGGSSSPAALPARWAALLLLLGFGAALVRLALDAIWKGGAARRAVTAGALVAGLAVAAAFLVNRNIYNSDNYRYLIYLLTPWSLGFGLCLDGLIRRGPRGRLAAVLIVASMGAGMTIAASRWYRETRHYLDERGYPVRIEQPPWWELVIRDDRPSPDDSRPTQERARHLAITPDVTHVLGGYWDVYRLAFLSGGRVVGVPYTMYPDRFPGWSAGLGPGRGKIMILRPSEGSASASRPAAERPGGRAGRVRSARSFDWRPALATAWQADGGDPDELDRLAVVVP